MKFFNEVKNDFIFFHARKRIEMKIFQDFCSITRKQVSEQRRNLGVVSNAASVS